MGLLDQLGNYMINYDTGVRLSQNPALQKQYFQQKNLADARNFKQQEIENKRRYMEEQNRQAGTSMANAIGTMAQPMEPGQEVNSLPTQFGQMDFNVGGTEVPRMEGFQPEQQATGAFQGASPEQIRQYQLMQNIANTGLASNVSTAQGMVNPMAQIGMSTQQSNINNMRQQATSRANTQANIQGQMARQQLINPYTQFNNNRDKYIDFMSESQKAKNIGKKDEINESLIKGENDLQKVYFKESNDFNAIDDAYARVKVAQDTGIGDTSLIFSIMKLMDPRSTVREGEAATAKNSAGIPAYIRNLWNDKVEGRSLSPEARNNILAQADSFYGASKGKYEQNLGKLQGVAERRGYNPANVFTRSFIKEEPSTNQPISNPGTKVIKEIKQEISGQWQGKSNKAELRRAELMRKAGE